MKEEETDAGLPLLSSLLFPGILYASTVRSSVRRARQVRMRQNALPPGYRYIGPADLRAENLSLGFSDDIPIFADGQVSYIGEAIGLIVGPDPGICDELAKATLADYEEEEPELEWESFSSSQIVSKYSAAYGDPDSAFSGSLHLERAVYRNGVFDHHYSEPVGAIANWEYDKLAIYCASQWPVHVRNSVAATTGVPEVDIVVKPTELGRAFDGRLWFPSLVACQAAVAARICGKPVKILYTREEDYLYTPKQARSSITIRSATDERGRLQALDIKLIINIGAYNPLAQELVHQAAASMMGIYSCPSIRLEAYAIRTNVIPLGALGSIGATHASFSIEAHMNHLAQALQKTPAEIKFLNMLPKDGSNFGAPPLDYEIPFAKIHRSLEKISDYRRKYASYELVKKRDPGCREGVVRGIAITVGFQTGRSFSDQALMNGYAVETTLDRNLDLLVNTQAAIGSDSLRSMWKATATAALSIPENKIHFLPPNTDSSSPSGPLTLSRGASVVNKLVERTCRAIQKKRFRESLPISAKAQMRMNPRSSGERNPVIAGQLFDSASWCGTAVEIEIDTLTGEPKPIAVWMVIEAGKIVLPELAVSSLRASVLSALNLCTGETFDTEGQNERQYLRCHTMRLSQVPYIGIEFIDSGKGGMARGLGELPFITVPAAFYSALTQALGVEPRQLPLEGKEILRLLEAT